MSIESIGKDSGIYVKLTENFGEQAFLLQPLEPLWNFVLWRTGGSGLSAQYKCEVGHVLGRGGNQWKSLPSLLQMEIFSHTKWLLDTVCIFKLLRFFTRISTGTNWFFCLSRSCKLLFPPMPQCTWVFNLQALYFRPVVNKLLCTRRFKTRQNFYPGNWAPYFL